LRQKYRLSNNASTQKGAALIMLFLVIMMTASIYFVTKLSVVNSPSSREQVTTDALAKAKQALLAYAVSNYERVGSGGWYGFLPSPETPSVASEGSVRPNGETGSNRYDHVLGRLPWKHMDIEPLKDASGECLWYAVTGDYKHGGTVRSEMLNEDSVGMFELYDENGNALRAGAAADRVVAVVIAPGAQLAGQARLAADPNLFCKVAPNAVVASDYLDAIGIHDNASLDTLQGLDTFVTARSQQNANINDRIITITQQEIFLAIRKSPLFMNRANAATESLALCVNEYITTNPVVTGGGCDAACMTQCTNDRTTCYNLCPACITVCNDEAGICRDANILPNRVCNQIRQNCRNTCVATCENACDTVFASCTAGGGGGGNNFWMPWPAPVALSLAIDDYRLNSSYDDAASNQTPGRLPETIDNSNTATGNPAADMFANCSAIVPTLNAFPALPASMNYTLVDDEYKVLWRHWKDHFFYVIGSGFEPSNAPDVGTPDCATTPASCVEVITAGVSSYYAAIVIYSGTATAAQARDLEKGIYTNYLESYDIANNRFDFSIGNDVAYCISDQRVISKCSP